MPMGNLVSLEAAGVLVKGLAGLAARDRKDHRLNDAISKALRTLYFPADGVLALLKEVASGTGLPSDALRERLVNFNDRQWQVEGALEVLDFTQLAKDLRVSLATARRLQEIRMGKIDLRRDIQEEVNYYGRRGVKPDLDKVRALIAAIEALNALIEETELRVNSRALER
jgi:hypothetical protein